MDRLEDQIDWYNKKSLSNQHIYKWIKTVEILAAAVIPFLSTLKFQYAGWITGGLGVLITVLEGMLHLNQYQQNWIAYRSTCELLKHEKFTFLAGGGAYANATNARALLAERVESLVSQEDTKWASIQQQESKPNAS